MLRYEKILATKCPDVAASPADDRGSESSISTDSVARDAQMRTIMTLSISRAEKLKAAVEAGQKRTELASKITGYYGTVFEYVQLYKPVIEAGLKNVSEAALPWAVVCSALDVSHLGS